MKLKDELLKIAQYLNQARVDFGLCGGLTVVVHGYPLLTKAIDILIRPDSLESTKSKLAEYDLEAGPFRFNDGTSDEGRI